MKQQFKQVLSMLFATAFIAVCFSACKKEAGSASVDYSKAPRKPAPSIMVGNWLFTQVSSTNIVDHLGHSVPTTMFGATFHVDVDGKGWEAITSTVNTYSYSNKEDVNSDGTYEIELGDGDQFTLKYYALQGKVYDNDHFSHYLVPEKLYPNKYYNWHCTFGEDSKGIYFENGESRYYKQ